MQKIRNISVLGLAMALPVSAFAQTCCPSGGNGVEARTATALSAQLAECCPSGGNGIRATGFGQGAPNALNLSVSPNWRVYVFQRAGVRYVQFNDAAGNVRGAVGVANGTLLALPMGSDQVRQVLGLPPGMLPIYDDAQISVVPLVSPDGTVEWLIVSKY